MSYRRNLRRLQHKRWAQVERQLEEASGKPFCDLAELLPIPAALARPDLAPAVMPALETAYLVRKTGARLYGDTCMACDRTWDTPLIGPVLALVVLMPEAKAGGASLVCSRCAWRPDLRERAIAFLRELYPDATMRMAPGPHWT